MDRTTDKIREIIAILERDNNIMPIDMPKDVRQRIVKNKQYCASLLQQAITIIEETRNFITNRAREELSHQKHADTYAQLNNALESGDDLHPNNWSEGWLMLVELQNLLEK